MSNEIVCSQSKNYFPSPDGASLLNDFAFLNSYRSKETGQIEFILEKLDFFSSLNPQTKPDDISHMNREEELTFIFECLQRFADMGSIRKQKKFWEYAIARLETCLQYEPVGSSAWESFNTLYESLKASVTLLKLEKIFNSAGLRNLPLSYSEHNGYGIDLDRVEDRVQEILCKASIPASVQNDGFYLKLNISPYFAIKV